MLLTKFSETVIMTESKLTKWTITL